MLMNIKSDIISLLSSMLRRLQGVGYNAKGHFGGEPVRGRRGGAHAGLHVRVGEQRHLAAGGDISEAAHFGNAQHCGLHHWLLAGGPRRTGLEVVDAVHDRWLVVHFASDERLRQHSTLSGHTPLHLARSGATQGGLPFAAHFLRCYVLH